MPALSYIIIVIYRSYLLANGLVRKRHFWLSLVFFPNSVSDFSVKYGLERRLSHRLLLSGIAREMWLSQLSIKNSAVSFFVFKFCSCFNSCHSSTYIPPVLHNFHNFFALSFSLSFSLLWTAREVSFVQHVFFVFFKISVDIVDRVINSFILLPSLCCHVFENYCVLLCILYTVEPCDIFPVHCVSNLRKC